MPSWLHLSRLLGPRDASPPASSMPLVAVAPHPTRLLRSLGRRPRSPRSEGSWAERQSSSPGGAKMVLVMRSDARMGSGKLAAQAAHGAVALYRSACEGRRSPLCREWDAAGGKKIVLRIDGEKGLLRLASAAKRLRLPCAVVRDAGRTQVAVGTVTGVAIFGKAGDVDKITGMLKLY